MSSDKELCIEDSGSESDEDVDYSSDDSNGDSTELSTIHQRQKVPAENLHLSPPRFTFNGVLCTNINFYNSYILYFENFVVDDFVNTIGIKTNRYANDFIHTHRKAKLFDELKLNELKVFFDINIFVRNNKKTWNGTSMVQNLLISASSCLQAIPFQRFKHHMKQLLNFSNNNNFYPNTKTKQNLVSYKCWSQNSRRYCYWWEFLLFKGNLSWIQYIRLKRACFGIKSYMLCESRVVSRTL